MIAQWKTLSDYPIEKFVGEGIVIDVRGQKEIETNLNSVKKEDIVFFLTSHSDKVYDKDYFDTNPVLTAKTAQGLVDKKIKMGLILPNFLFLAISFLTWILDKSAILAV